MYVRRLALHGVKNLDRDIPEGGGPLPEATRKKLLLQGGNGSGKSTVLATIRALWELFGELIDIGGGTLAHQGVLTVDELSFVSPLLRGAEWAAVEFGDFPLPELSLWVGVGTADAVVSRVPSNGSFAGVVRSSSAHVRAKVEVPTYDWTAFRHQSMVGSVPQPNVVYFPADGRGVTSETDRARIVDTTKLNWLASYSPELNLESALLTLKALRPADYDEAVHFVNLALRHRNKQIVGWGQDGRLAVEGRTDSGRPYRHPTDQLSSGERQVLLMIAYVAGFLRPGGIVLIDEPDLHIHIGLIGQLVGTLEVIVRRRGGQLIVASHSADVWDHFTRDSEKIDLTPYRRPDQ